MTRVHLIAVRGFMVTVLSASFYGSTVVGQAPGYSIVDLGTLGGKRSVARDVNVSGEVVGYSETADGDTHAFVYVAGNMRDLGTFGGNSSVAHRITDSGIIVGRGQTVDGRHQPFVAYRGTQLLEPASFTTHLQGSFGDVLGVNAAGQAVGYYTTAGAHMTARNRVFLFESLSLKDLGTFGGQDGVVTAINARGHMVGYFGMDQHAEYSDQRSFLVTTTATVILPTLGGRTTVALDVNDHDAAVGHAQTADGERRAFRFQQGVLTDLGALAGGRQSFAYGVNNAGQIVGASEAQSGSLRAVLYELGQVIDLNTRIPQQSGWLLTEARSINAEGQIVGTGILDGAERAFLLTPVAAGSQPRQ